MTKQPSLEPSSTLAYIIGVVLGDGSVSSSHCHYRIHLDVKDQSFAKSFAIALQELGLHPLEYKRIGSTYNKTGIYYRVEANSKNMYTFLREAKINISSINSHLKTDEFKIAFLKGFYESEGSLSVRTDGVYKKEYPMIQIYNKDKSKLNLVCGFLEYLGFSPKLYFYEKSQYGRVSLSKKLEVYRFLGMIQPCIKNVTALLDYLGLQSEQQAYQPFGIEQSTPPLDYRPSSTPSLSSA